jgi:integrase/recombinase XerC
MTYLQEYQEHLELIEGVSKLTVEKYVNNISRVLGWSGYGESDLSSWRYITLMKVIKALRERSLSNSTINSYINSFKSLYNFMEKMDYVDENPAKDIELFDVKNDNINNKALTRNQVVELFANIKSNKRRNWRRNLAIITLFASTGMRLSELHGIKISDINFENNSVYIERKGGKSIDMPLNDMIKITIKDYINNERRQCDNDYLFVSNQGKHMSKRSIQKMVKSRLSLVAEDELCHVHTLRHTAISQMVKNGVDLNTVRELASHSSIQTTQLYMSSDNETKQKAIASIY